MRQKTLFLVYFVPILFLACAVAQAAPSESGDPVDLTTFLKPFFAAESPSRWQVLGADGRVLDVSERNENFVGQSVILQPPPAGAPNRSSQISQILNARAKTPRNPEMITVNLGTEFAAPVDAATVAMVVPQARIIWGCGGAKFVATVDINKGSQVSVAANFLQVDGVYFAPVGVGGAAASVRVSASLAYGSRPPSAFAPTFSDFASLTGGVVSTFAVPNFAKDLTLYTVTGGGVNSDLTIAFSSSEVGATAQAVILQNQAAAPNTVSSKPYPVPGWARSLLLLSNVNANASMVWGLAL